MNTAVVDLRLPREGESVKVVLAGDFHWGSAYCREDLVKEFVAQHAEARNTYIITMGDELDLVWRRDHKRFEPHAVHARYRNEENMVGRMRKDFVRVMAPLRGKVVASCDSNHMASYRKHADLDLYEEFCGAMGSVPLGYGGYVIFRLHRQGRSPADVAFAVCHGRGRAGTPGGHLNNVYKDGIIFQSALVAHGHTHQLRAPGSRRWFDWGGNGIVTRCQKIAQTGSFLETYSTGSHRDGYGASHRYEPNDLGWIVAEIVRDYRTGGPRLRVYAEEF